MRHPKFRACIPAAFLLIAVPHAWADTMRCGTRIIQKGDPMPIMKALCGVPTSVDHSAMMTSSTVLARGPGLHQRRAR